MQNLTQNKYELVDIDSQDTRLCMELWFHNDQGNCVHKYKIYRYVLRINKN